MVPMTTDEDRVMREITLQSDTEVYTPQSNLKLLTDDRNIKESLMTVQSSIQFCTT